MAHTVTAVQAILYSYPYGYAYIYFVQRQMLHSGILAPEIHVGPDLKIWHTGLT